MGVSQLQTGSVSILATATQIGSTITTAGQYQCVVQLDALIAGDQFNFWAEVKNQAGQSNYKLAGSQTTVGGVQTEKDLSIPQGMPAIVSNEVTFWGQWITGANRTVFFSLNEITATISGTVNANVVQISGDSTAADNLEAYCDGTTPMPVNAIQISGDATAADNLEAYSDGTTPQPVNVTQFGGASGTFSSGRPEVNTSHAAGTAWNSGAIGASTLASDTITAAKIASDAITAAKLAADCITAAKVANGAIDAATFAADVDAEILSYIVDDATRIDASALNTATATTIPAILTDTAEIGAAGAGLTALPWNASWDAEVQSEVQDAIEVNHLDHLLAVTYDPASKPGAADALLNELVESDAGVARYTANALEQAPTGGSAPSASDIADEVQTRTIAAVTTVAAVSGDVGGKVLGGGAGTITGTGVRAVDASGNAIAPASTALSTATWTGTRAGYLDNIATAPPTAATTASAVRTELTTELGRIDAAITTRLAPTTAGRTLDVTATGAAGIDLANVENQGTTLALSATTVATVTTLTNAPSDSSGTTTLLSRLSSARAGYLDNLSAGAVATAAALTTAAADITTLLGKLTGITSLAQWLGLIAGKQTANSTALAEIRATGTGSGTYTPTTDSLESLREQADLLATADALSQVGTLVFNVGADVDLLEVAVGDIGNRTQYIPDNPATEETLATLSTLTAAEVNAEVDAALADVGLTTTVTGRIDAAISTRSTYAGTDTSGTTTLLSRLTATRAGYIDNLSAGAVATAANLATLTAYVDTEVAAIKVVTDQLGDTLEDDAGTYRFTANALEEAPSSGGSAPTAEENADAVRVELATELARIDAAITSRLATGDYTAAPTATTIADAVLTRSTDSTDGDTVVKRSLGALIRLGTNSSAAGSTVTVRKGDGTSWTTFTVTTDDAADPTTGIV